MELHFASHCTNTDMVEAYKSLSLTHMTIQLYIDISATMKGAGMSYVFTTLLPWEKKNLTKVDI